MKAGGPKGRGRCGARGWPRAEDACWPGGGGKHREDEDAQECSGDAYRSSCFWPPD